MGEQCALSSKLKIFVDVLLTPLPGFVAYKRSMRCPLDSQLAIHAKSRCRSRKGVEVDSNLASNVVSESESREQVQKS